jgi:2-iminobutanoate/2-iminopropanoate deaminase
MAPNRQICAFRSLGYIFRADSNTFFIQWKKKSFAGQRRTAVTTNSRLVLQLALAIGIVLTIVPAWQHISAQERKAINLAPARGLPFSDGILAGNTLYVAGQEGTDDMGKLAEGGIGPETKATLDNIEKVLKAAGFDLKDVVSVTVYLADIHEFADMNKVYKSFMPDPKPARATIQAAGLVNNAHIEISAIAVKQPK